MHGQTLTLMYVYMMHVSMIHIYTLLDHPMMYVCMFDAYILDPDTRGHDAHIYDA